MSNTQSAFSVVVEEPWRYQVKSMQGEQLNQTQVTERGLLGDRASALRDNSNGKIATAKNPRKWPNLFDYSAVLLGGPAVGEELPAARITFPDGTTLATDHAQTSRMLSAALKRDVTLARSHRAERKPTRIKQRDLGGILARHGGSGASGHGH